MTGSCLLLEVNADAFFVNLGGAGAPLRSDRYGPPRQVPATAAASALPSHQPAYQKRPPLRNPKAYGSQPPPQQQVAAPTYQAGKPAAQKPLKPGKPHQQQQQQHYTKKPVYPSKTQQQAYPPRPLQQQKPVAPYGKPYQPQAARPLRPNNGLKLDYSGWTPIDFDDSLPGVGTANGLHQELPDVVTVDVAIANAPAAQTDDFPSTFPATLYSQPAPEPITAENPLPLPPPSLVALGPSRPVQVPSTYGAPVPAVPYIPSTADLPIYSSVPSASPKPVYSPPPTAQYQPSPSPAQYQPSPSPAQYQPSPSPAQYQPSTSPAQYQPPVLAASPQPPPALSQPPAYPIAPALAPSSLYGAPAAAPAQLPALYNAPAAPSKVPTISSLYNVPQREPTKAPVVLPAFTPAPTDDSLQSYGRSQQTYDTSFLGGRNFPIVSLLPSDSQEQQQEEEEEEKFISFTFGQEEPAQYQNTADAASLAQDVASGSVYVQQQQQQQQLANDLNDELYYIYYQDPDQDPNFGAKNKPVRAAAATTAAAAPAETLDASSVVQRTELRAVAPAPDLPLYDYEEGLGEVQRDVREEEQEEVEEHQSQPVVASYRPLSGTSSVSFNLNVGGKSSGFSYNL